MIHTRKSRSVISAFLLTISMASPAFALSYCFFSYAEVEGFVYDDSGNPLADVQVSYIDPQDFFRTFTDSAGRFHLKLKMSDGTGFSRIRSEEQVEICRKHMNSRVPYFLLLFSNIGRKSGELLGKNLYEREVSLSFKKLGVDSAAIDTVIFCGMRDEDLKLNSIGVIRMKRSHTYDSLGHVKSRLYFTNKIIYNDINSWFIYKDSKYWTPTASGCGSDFLSRIDEGYVNDELMAYGKRACLYCTVGGYLIPAGLGIGIGGAALTEGSDRIYPIAVGLLTCVSGCYLTWKSHDMSLEFIYRYNKDLDQRFLIGIRY